MTSVDCFSFLSKGRCHERQAFLDKEADRHILRVAGLYQATVEWKNEPPSALEKIRVLYDEADALMPPITTSGGVEVVGIGVLPGNEKRFILVRGSGVLQVQVEDGNWDYWNLTVALRDEDAEVTKLSFRSFPD